MLVMLVGCELVGLLVIFICWGCCFLFFVGDVLMFILGKCSLVCDVLVLFVGRGDGVGLGCNEIVGWVVVVFDGLGLNGVGVESVC